MDPKPIWPQLHHPIVKLRSRDFKSSAKHRSRTMHPTRYFLIDFGLSTRFNPDDGEPLDYGIIGGDKSVPELQNGGDLELKNPFAIDVYYLGNMLRKTFLRVSTTTRILTRRQTYAFGYSNIAAWSFSTKLSLTWFKTIHASVRQWAMLFRASTRYRSLFHSENCGLISSNTTSEGGSPSMRISFAERSYTGLCFAQPYHRHAPLSAELLRAPFDSQFPTSMYFGSAIALLQRYLGGQEHAIRTLRRQSPRRVKKQVGVLV